MADSSRKAREAIYAALSAEADLTALVSDRVYSGVARQNTAFPYVIIGERSTDQRFKTKDATIQSHRVRIYAYSRKKSPIQAEDIKAAIFKALDKQSLTVSGAAFVDSMQDGLDDMALMEDGRTYRALVEFLVTIQ